MNNKSNQISRALGYGALVCVIVAGVLGILASGGGGEPSGGISGGGGGGGGGVPGGSTPFDDFSADMIDRTKWADLEFVRWINNGALESALTRFGSDGSNNLNVINPDTVNTLQANVTVTAVSTTNAEAQARIVGDFYNDGTSGDGFIGDVVASTEIRHNGTALVVALVVVRCDDLDCVAYTTLKRDDTTFGPIALGETHTLSVAWNGAVFTFGFDGATITFDPREVAHVAGPPQAASRFKGIGTRVSGIAAPDAGAFIGARFDDVEVNGSPYDDFESGVIDRTKWADLEFVRWINNGALESALTRFDSDGSNDLNLIDADNHTVSALQADVTVTAVSTTNAEAQARIVGDFYNDGTSGDGFIGDVVASTEIRHNGTGLVGSFRVFVCGDFDCISGTTVFLDDTPGPVALGETHTLSVAWNGAVFTFGFDGIIVTFDPRATAPRVAAPRQPRKYIGTRVSGIVAPDQGAFIAATFDNVRVAPIANVVPHTVP